MIKIKRMETDVLVIGGGAAGMRAAIAANDTGAKVMLLDKGLIGRSGMSGTIPYWNVPAPIIPEEDEYFEDLMRSSHGLADPRLLKVLVSEARDRVMELEEYGNIFTRDSLGGVSPIQAEGHSKARVFTPAYSWIMAMQLFRRGVMVHDETFVTSLLKVGDRVVGAVAISLKEGVLLAIKSKATIIATGGAGHVFGMDTRLWQSTNPVELTGDGYALAYNAGAELVDMEFNQVVLEPQYSSGLGQTFTSSALALARSLRSSEAFQGAPSVHHMLGGVVIDEHGRTSIPGLYACGEVAGGLHLKATDQFIGCLVFGKRAGEAAAKEERGGDLSMNEVAREVDRVLSVLNSNPENPLTPHILRRRLMNTMWNKVGLAKSEKSLIEALNVIEEVKSSLPRMHVRDKTKIFNKEWIEALETYNMVIVAEMIVRASLLRRESRGVFRRVDYPKADDRYLGHIYVKKKGNEMVLEFKPIAREEAVKVVR